MNNENKHKIQVLADHREQASKIPIKLENHGADVELATLKYGDYLINNEILIERKSKNDFVLSLMQGRLFAQCSKLALSYYTTLLLIEGNPYHTQHNISREAIKGALLSISVRWRIPIVYTSNTDDTAQSLINIGQQNIKYKFNNKRAGYQPKAPKKRVLYFLQGLPLVGSELAKKLLKHFGTLQNIANANEEALLKVDGIGKQKAKRIIEFLTAKLKD